MGKGGGGAPQPTSQNVNQSNLPEYARPYFEDIMNRGQAVSQAQYTPYTGQRQAGFTPLQEQGFQGVSGLGVSPLMGPAAGITGAAGIGGLQAGQNYAQQATSPGAMQSYMSPYMQNVVDFQKTQAVQDYGRQLPGQQAAATRAGAFGGSRQAIVESEAQRNLQNQLAGIQATGTQQAYDQANKNLQFGSSLGLQGLDTAGRMGAQFGQLGQTAFGQQAAAAQAQQAAGATQQAQAQTGLDQGYEEFMRQQLYPQSQLQFLSSLLRGSVVSPDQIHYKYNAPASTANQLATLGLGAYGTSKLFGAKEGGEVKKYAVGGIVGGKSPEQQYKLALQMPIDRLLAIMQGQPGEVDQTSAMLAYKLKKETQIAQDGANAQDQASQPSVLQQQIAQSGIEAVPVENMGIPDGGIAGEEPVAMADGGEVPGGVRPFTWDFQSFAERKERERQRQRALKGLSAEDYAQNDRELSRLGIMRSDEPEAQSTGPTSVVGMPPTPAVPARKSAPTSKPGIAALIPVGSRAQEPEAAAYGDSSIQGKAPPLSSAAQESEEDMLKRFAEQAGSYTKAEREALRKAEQESQAKGEKGLAALRDESRGVAALRAAAELGKGGRRGIESIGAAFGAAGETGADYGKQQRVFEKDLEKSRMDMAKAELAFKQGDFELGSKLMNMSQDRKLKAAELAGQTAYREAMVALQGTELDERKRHNIATEKAELAKISVLRDTGLARASEKTGLSAKDLANIKDKAVDNAKAVLSSPATLLGLRKQYPGLSDDKLRDRVIEMEMRKLLPPGYLPTEAPKSIQIPDAAAGSFLDATK
jgi:hypothetical protein